MNKWKHKIVTLTLKSMGSQIRQIAWGGYIAPPLLSQEPLVRMTWNFSQISDWSWTFLSMLKNCKIFRPTAWFGLKRPKIGLFQFWAFYIKTARPTNITLLYKNISYTISDKKWLYNFFQKCRLHTVLRHAIYMKKVRYVDDTYGT